MARRTRFRWRRRSAGDRNAECRRAAAARRIKERTMTANVGTFDRIARIAVGIALIAFALGYIAPGTSWAWVGWIGVVPILSALFGTCPAFSMLGCSTR